MADTASSRLKNKIQIQSRTVTFGAGGGKIETWKTGPDRKAEVSYRRGGEFFERSGIPQKDAENLVYIYIRYRRGLSVADNRVVYGKTTFDITAIKHNTGRTLTELWAVARETHQDEGGVNA